MVEQQQEWERKKENNSGIKFDGNKNKNNTDTDEYANEINDFDQQKNLLQKNRKKKIWQQMNRCARKNEKKNRHRHGHTRSQHDTKIWCVDRFYTQNKWVIYSTHSLTHNVCRVVSCLSNWQIIVVDFLIYLIDSTQSFHAMQSTKKHQHTEIKPNKRWQSKLKLKLELNAINKSEPENGNNKYVYIYKWWRPVS